MDSHLFRRFCEDLMPHLAGARLEKIHQPGPGVSVFTLYGFFGGEACKRYLVLRAERKSPLIFLAESRIPVNAHPPAPIMRLRKYLSDKRVSSALCHWTERRIYLEFVGEGLPALCLDLREGPGLVFDGVPTFTEPEWPGEEGGLLPLLEGDEWRRWPVLTPALRRTLACLDELDAQALLLDLRAGGGDVFLYEDGAGQREVSAWPLLGTQLARLDRGWRESVWPGPVAPLALAGETQVYSHLASSAKQAVSRPFSAEAARLTRLQQKLDKEEERLLALCSGREDALLLQSQLYRFGAEEKAESIVLEGKCGPREIRLDPKLTIRENMEAMFHRAGRGKRGLEHLPRRKEAVAADKEAAMQAMLRNEANLSGTGGAERSVPGARGPAAGSRNAPSGLPRQVQAFRSSDGFILLRGRDTKGNALALKLAAPHDYWLHTAQGPSAHVVIRRDHAGQDVPQRTLEEAGALAALKSWLKDEERAQIQYSLAKYIHPMKKAAPGTVRIDRSEGTFTVRLEPGLEKRMGLSQ